MLGAVAGVLAGVGASAIGWLLAEQVFRIDYLPGLLPVSAGAALGALGVLAGGWAGVRRLLDRPPLASLRALG
jgi:putative ABC transport system permease protein